MLLRPAQKKEDSRDQKADISMVYRAQLPELRGRRGPEGRMGMLPDSWGNRRLLRDGGLEEQSEGVPGEGQGVVGMRRDHECMRQAWKWAQPMAGPAAVTWLQWKIPTRGENSIQQIFMAPTQYKEEGQAESLGTAPCWHHGVTDRVTFRVPGADEGLGEGAGARSGAKDLLGPRDTSAAWGRELSSPLGAPTFGKNC